MLAATALWLLTVLWTVNGALLAGLVGLIAVGGVLAHITSTSTFGKSTSFGIAMFAALIAPTLIAPPVLEQPATSTRSSWLPYSADLVAAEVNKGQTVFVDVTADWCLTCKANKRLVLDSGQVASAFSADTVTTVRADWTRADPAITAYLMDNGRFGIPFNIIYGPNAPNGIALPEILTKAKVLEALTAAR
jgi:suppressor for copper-sensitivity B